MFEGMEYGITTSIRNQIEGKEYRIDETGMSGSRILLFSDMVLKVQRKSRETEQDTFGPDGFRDPKELLDWLFRNRPEEEAVLSHGDYCLPNVFGKGNRLTGYLDLGRAGIADKWCDIALCYRSLSQNYSGRFHGKAYSGYDDLLLFKEIGIAPDWKKIRYYILLDELF